MTDITLILLGAGLFTALVMILVMVILLAKSKLIPAEKISITINDDPEHIYSVQRGKKLLNALSDYEIYLPSACGGKGTCAQCKIVVQQGGGSVLPTEKSVITRKEIREGYRLACQLSVKDDLKLQIPPEIFEIKKIECRVRSNKNVATFIKELVLELPKGEEMDFQAGGYIQIDAPPHTVHYRDFDIPESCRKAWDSENLWHYSSRVDETIMKAYSMANYPEEKGVIMLNVRICPPPLHKPHVPPGQLSSFLFNLKPGDKVTISGPYGEFFARDTDREMILVGGGAGMAPLRSIIFDQLKKKKSTRKISFWYGARSLQEAFYQEDFNQLEKEFDNFTWTLALSEPLPEDNWDGPAGFIHQVLYDNYLKNHAEPDDCEYYLCGPPLMIEAVLKLLDNLGVEPEDILFDDFEA